MVAEIENYHKENDRLELASGENKLKIRSLEKEIDKQRNMTKMAESIIKKFRTDLHTIVHDHLDPKMIRVMMLLRHEKSVILTNLNTGSITHSLSPLL